MTDLSHADQSGLAWPQRRWLLCLASVAGLASVLRLPGLGSSSLWWDECHTLKTALAVQKAPFSKVISAALEGLSSYFILVAGWVRPDISEFALRLPSALAGIVLPVLLAKWGKAIGSESLGWRLGVAGAVSPFFVWHSREARWYPFTWLLVCLGALCFFKVLHSVDWRWVAGCLAAGLLAASTYAPAIAVVVIQAGWILVSRNLRRDLTQKWWEMPGKKRNTCVSVIGTCLLVACAWLWVALLAPIVREGPAGYRFSNVGGPKLGPVAYTGIAFATGYTLGPGPAEWHLVKLGELALGEIGILGVGVALLLGLTTAGVVSLWRTGQVRLAISLLSLAVLPTALLVLACWWTDHAYAPRYAGISYPFILCLAAAGTRGRAGTRTLGVLSVALVALQAVSLWNLHFNPRYEREDVRAAAQFVAAQAAPDELVLVFGGIDLPWKHYYHGQTPSRFVYSGKGSEWSPDDLQRLLGGQSQVWAVQGRMWEDPGASPLLEALEGWGSGAERMEFPGRVSVTRHQAPNPSRLPSVQ